jgi:hypothetical protein
VKGRGDRERERGEGKEKEIWDKGREKRREGRGEWEKRNWKGNGITARGELILVGEWVGGREGSS